MAISETYIGRPLRRVDGPLKVTGAAKYAGEYPADKLLYGYIVSSTVTKGRIVSIDTSAAEAMPGVVKVFTHENRPKLSENSDDYKDMTAPPGEHFRPLGSDKILFSDQPIALIVAETFEAARDAVSLVKVTYEVEEHRTDFEAAKASAYVPPKKRDE